MPDAYHEGDEPVPGSGYRLVKFLGRGGFGEVWKASSPGGAETAIKIIRLGSAEGRKEFRALQLVKRIRHPNLMPLFASWLKGADGAVLDEAAIAAEEVGPVESVSQTLSRTMLERRNYGQSQAAELVIAMGLGDKSLFDRLEECLTAGMCGIPRDELLRYIEDAAEALDFLNSPVHNQGRGPIAVQHCDIKPHNIMIVGGAVQVCDFGLARMQGSNTASVAAMTLAYAAPECMETGNPSPTTDQYSLAITYYELLSGALPYSSRTVAAVIAAKREGVLDFSAAAAAEQAVLRRATAYQPQERYASSLEMVAALRAASLDASAPAPGGPPRRGARLRGAFFAAGTVVLIAAGAFGAWRSWEAAHGPRPPATAPVASTALVAPAPAVKLDVKLDVKPDVKLDVKPAATSEVKPAPQPVAPQPRPEVPPKKPPEESVEDLLARGTAALEHGALDEAVAEFTRAAARAPNDPRIFSRRGAAWFRKKEFAQAVADFSAAIHIAPDARDFLNRGRASSALEQNDSAIADFTAATKLDAANAGAYYLRGDAYLGADQYERALTDLSEAIRLARQQPDPAFALADAYTLRGLCHLLMKHGDPAIADFSSALRSGVKDPAAIHESRAQAYDAKARADLAKIDRQLAAWRKQLEAQPNDAETCRQLADLLATSPEENIHDGNAALDLATRACELTMWKNAACLDSLATAYDALGRHPEAIQWATKAVEAASDPAAGEQYRAKLERRRAAKPR